MGRILGFMEGSVPRKFAANAVLVLPKNPAGTVKEPDWYCEITQNNIRRKEID